MFTKRVLTGAMLAMAVMGAGAFGADMGPVFSKPERLRYDGHSFIIDGKPFFNYSGEMHYWRVPRELWKTRLESMKAAGFTTVDTYLAWNVHEAEEPAGVDDFSKLKGMEDIGDFIQTAQDAGLYVMVRPGPYICAEWDRGALPGWLMKYKPADDKSPEYLRGNNATILGWEKHWITAAAKVVKPHLVTNLPAGKPGVILWQLENEYNYVKLPSEMRADVLRALAHDSDDAGIDVPYLTCYTEDPLFRADPYLMSHVWETTNSYPGFNMDNFLKDMKKTFDYQPERLHGITELQGGWFAKIGGKLSDQQGHNAAQITQLSLAAMEKGVTSMNYYMFYGGSNFGPWGGAGLIQSYDYNAPLREPGGIGDRYLAVAAIGGMLKDHGLQLTRAEGVDLDVVKNSFKDVSVAERRAEDGARFYFVRTPQNKEARLGSMTVKEKGGDGKELTINYDLGVFGAKVFYLAPGASDAASGEWLPKAVAAPERPTEIPGVVPVSVVGTRADKATDWAEVPAGKMLDAVNVFDQRYVTYRLTFVLGAADPKEGLLVHVKSHGGGSELVTWVNGSEGRVKLDKNGEGDVEIGNKGAVGTNTVEMLFENMGAPNFGPELEDEEGISEVRVMVEAPRAGARHDAGVKVAQWQVSRSTEGMDGHWENAGTGWNADGSAKPDGALTWYRMEFETPKATPHAWVPWHLHLNAAANGFLYFNGHMLGRYWAVGPQREYWLPECWMKGDGTKNVLALQATATGEKQVIEAVELRPYGEYAEKR